MGSFFEGVRPGHPVRVDGQEFEMPVLYFRDDSFQALFTADMQKLRAAMPSDRLHPIEVRGGRGLVGIAAFDYLDTSVERYGELAIVVPAVHGSRPPPLLPAVLEASWPGFGAVVLHLPVTEKVACDAGRMLFGYSKFVADMQFQNTPEHHEVRLAEGDEHVLTLRVMKRGISLPDRRPVVTYSVKEGSLLRTTIPQRAMARIALGAGGSSLVLGDRHPVAQSLRDLDIDTRPVATRYFLERAAILPEGEIIERNVRPLEGYRGTDRARGELRVEHVAVLH